MHVVENGREQNAPILFVHGWPQDWSSWTRILELAGEDHRAIAIDPRFAFAFAKRALCLINITYYESDVASRVTLRQEARSAAEQAVELAPNLGEAHLALAKVLFAGFFDFAAAEPEPRSCWPYAAKLTGYAPVAVPTGVVNESG